MRKFYVWSKDLKKIVMSNTTMGAAVLAAQQNETRKPGALCTGSYFFIDERGFRDEGYAAYQIASEQVYAVLEEMEK